MKLRMLGLGVAVALALGALALATTALASGTITTRFRATLSAEVSGSVKFSPGLLLTAGSGSTVRVTTTGTLSSVAGTTAYGDTTITGGSYRSVVTLPAGSSCLSLESDGLPPGAGKVVFTSSGTPPAAPSTVRWGGESASGPPLTIGLGGSGTSVKGSFAKPSGPSSVATLIIDQNPTALLDACESAKGLTRMTFTGKVGVLRLMLG
jgi:hypothetical protein